MQMTDVKGWQREQYSCTMKQDIAVMLILEQAHSIIQVKGHGGPVEYVGEGGQMTKY